MKQKVLMGLAFALLVVMGAVAAAIVAKKAPSSVQQTVSGTLTTATTSTTTTVPTVTTVPTKRKVTICHHTQGKKGTKHVTITVSESALKAHLKHGDSIGRCNTAAAKRFHSRPAHVKKFHHKAKQKHGH